MSGDCERQEIAMVEKNGVEEIRVALDSFKGIRLVDVRVFAEFAGAAKVRGPTKKGVAVQPHQLRALIDALRQAEVAAVAAGWLEGKGE